MKTLALPLLACLFWHLVEHIFFYTSLSGTHCRGLNLINLLVIIALVFYLVLKPYSTKKKKSLAGTFCRTLLCDWFLFRCLVQCHSGEGILKAEELRAAAHKFTRRHPERSGRLYPLPSLHNRAKNKYGSLQKLYLCYTSLCALAHR